MLRLDKLQLTQFKNYDYSSFDFTGRVVGICGKNGKGKTNLLDAIYYVCFTKSYFSKTEQFNVLFGKEGFRLEANLSSQIVPEDSEALHKFVVIMKPGDKKQVLLDDVEYEKFSGHIGKFPCVMIAPDDVEIITGSSDLRRKFIDTLLSQTDRNYLQHLINYNKIIQQRNSYLKSLSESRSKDFELLDIFDSQLIIPGNYIHEKRGFFTKTLVPLAKQFYMDISGKEEQIEIKYESQLNNFDLATLLKQTREKDLFTLRSNVGIHKDDIITLLNEMPFKAIASQGQRKSLLFSLKLAEYEILKANKGFAPFLLLDDVFEKLDEIRMNNLLEWVCVHNQGQVFITDTHRDRLLKALNEIGVEPFIIELN